MSGLYEPQYPGCRSSSAGLGTPSREDAISIVPSFTIHRIVHDRIWLGVRITLRLRS